MYTPRMVRIEIKRRRWCAALVLAAFCLAGIHQSGAAQVLCIGEDGHLQVEFYGDDCCVDTGKAPLLDRNNPVDGRDAADANHCGACTDILLTKSGQVAIQRVPVNLPDAQASPANADGALNLVSQLTPQPQRVFKSPLPHLSSTPLPLLL